MEHTEENNATLHLKKGKGRIKTSGAEFEYKLSALMFLRASAECELRFDLATNVSGAEPMDDIFLKARWTRKGKERSASYFFQLKHKDSECNVGTQALKAESGDFSIKKYFECYKKFHELHRGVEKKTTNQKKFLECEWEDIWFVMYTNASVTHSSDAIPASEFPLLNTFTTNNDANSVFRFTEKDEEVWNLYKGTADEKLYTEHYLQKLIVCSNQTHASEMNLFIQKELGKILGMEHPLLSRLTEDYIKDLHAWWDKDNGRCLTEKSCEIENVIKSGINDINLQETSKCSIGFTNETCEALAEQCFGNRFLIAIAPEIHELLRHVKIKKALDHFNRGTYIIINRNILSKFPKKYIISTCLKVCDILIVIDDNICDTLNEIILEFSKSKEKKIIIYSSKKISLKRKYDETSVEWQDTWTVEDFDTDTTEKVKISNIYFQKFKTKFCDIEKLWPKIKKHVSGNMLNSLLLCHEPDVSFGEDDYNDDFSFYVERVVQHPSTINRKFLNEKPDSEHLVTKGFTKNIFPELYNENRKQRNITVSELDPMTNGNKDSVKEDEERLATHWLAYEYENIIWEKTDTEQNLNELTIQKYLEKLCDSCQCLPNCSHKEKDLLTWRSKVIILTGDPGTGKSTFLKQWSRVLKQKNPKRWVVLMIMKELENSIEKLPPPKEITKDHVIDVMAAAVGVEGSAFESQAKYFLKDCVKKSSDTVVLVDGVDELCPTHKEKVMRILNIIRKCKVAQLWITARKNLDDDLRCEFGTISVTLAPFTKEDSMKYLEYLFKEKGYNADEVSKYVEAAYMNPPLSQYKVIQSMFENPLHLKILSEIYQEKHIINTKKFTELNLNILTLYNLFCDKKLRVFWMKLGISEDTLRNSTVLEALRKYFLEIHINCAMVNLFSNTSIDISSCATFVRKEKSDILKEKSGLITTFKHDVPTFIHHTFGEYFAAHWFVNNYTTNRKFIKEYFFLPRYEVIRLFFDHILAEGSPLHKAVLDDRRDIEDLLGDHKGKRDKGERLALHLAALYGRKEAAEMLLAAGSDLSACDKIMGWTPLRYADAAGHLEIAEMLVQKGGSFVDMPVFYARMNFIIHLLMPMLQIHYGPNHSAHVEQFVSNLTFPRMVSPSRKDFYKSRIASFEDDEYIVKEIVGEMSHRRTSQRPLFHTLSDNCTRLLIAMIGTGDKIYQAFRGDINLFPFRLLSVLRGDGFMIETYVGLNNIFLVFEKQNRSFGGEKEIVYLLLIKNDKERQFSSTNLAHNVSQYCQYDILKTLLGLGMSLDVRDSMGNTPLHKALEINNRVPWKIREKCVKELIKNGADCNSKNIEGSTPFHYVCKNPIPPELTLHILKLMSDTGRGFQLRDKWERLPLHYASVRGIVSVCDWLIQNGNDCNERDIYGHTPLHTAAYSNLVPQSTMKETIHFLLEKGADCKIEDKEGHTPVFYAFGKGYTEVVSLLLNSKFNPHERCENDASLLHMACKAGSLSLVKRFVNLKMDVNNKDSDGRTPLHYLSCRFPDPNGSSVSKEKSKILSYLLKHGADINTRDNHQRTALHYASQFHWFSLIKDLLKANVGINAKDKDGKTALHYAAFYGRECIVRKLVERGSKYDAKDKKDRTPLFLAAAEGHVELVDYLITKGADKNASALNEITPLIISSWNSRNTVLRLLLKRGADKKKVNNLGQNALHVAIQKENYPGAEILLENGIDFNVKDHRKFSGFDYVFEYDNGFSPENVRLFSLMLSGKKNYEANMYYFLETDEEVQIRKWFYAIKIFRRLNPDMFNNKKIADKSFVTCNERVKERVPEEYLSIIAYLKCEYCKKRHYLSS